MNARLKAAWLLSLVVGGLAIPIGILIYGFISGFGVPDSHLDVIIPALAQVTTPPAGFFQGLWDGIILPVSIVWSWIDPSVAPWNIHNDGWPYWLGFFLMGGGEIYAIFGVRKSD